MMKHTAEQIMAQAQVFASSWSLVGSPFDDGEQGESAAFEKDVLKEMIHGLDAENVILRAALQTQAEEAAKLMAQRDDDADLVTKAMRRAWQLGQTYWQQADSDYVSQHKKSDETQQKFQQLIDETIAAITNATL